MVLSLFKSWGIHQDFPPHPELLLFSSPEQWAKISKKWKKMREVTPSLSQRLNSMLLFEIFSKRLDLIYGNMENISKKTRLKNHFATILRHPNLHYFSPFIEHCELAATQCSICLKSVRNSLEPSGWQRGLQIGLNSMKWIALMGAVAPGRGGGVVSCNRRWTCWGFTLWNVAFTQ